MFIKDIINTSTPTCFFGFILTSHFNDCDCGVRGLLLSILCSLLSAKCTMWIIYVYVSNGCFIHNMYFSSYAYDLHICVNIDTHPCIPVHKCTVSKKYMIGKYVFIFVVCNCLKISDNCECKTKIRTLHCLVLQQPMPYIYMYGTRI